MIKHRLYDVLFNSKYELPGLLGVLTYQKTLADYLDSVLTVSEHHHRYLLLNNGHISDYIYFVEKGIVRSFYFDEPYHREVTTIIWDEQSMVLDPVSFFYRRPTDASIEVMPGSILLSLSYNHLQEAFRLFPPTEAFAKYIALQYVKYNAQRVRELTTLSAWSRYVKLLQAHPGIELQLSKEIIASYLNITPQSLSRMLKNKRHP